MATRTVVGFMAPGGPEVLGVHEVPAREPGPGEVAIAVAAAAVNPTDTVMRAGIRGVPDTDPPWVPGMDAAGTVVAVGEGVDRLTVGQEVMAAVSPRRPEGGAYTSLLVVPAAQVVPIPEGATVEQAATLPMNGLTAIWALNQLGLRPGDTFAVTGGAGWLGRLAIGLAVEAGLRVVADAKPEDEALVRAVGAHEVVPRGPDVGRAIAEVTGGGADGLLDASLQNAEALPGVRDGGGLAAVRQFTATPERGITVHRVAVFDHLDDTEGLQRLADLAARGVLPMEVAGTYPPEEAAEAHRRFQAGGVRGRLLITF